MLLGCTWGLRGEYVLGKAAAGLRDIRPGRGHLPHPFLLRLTRLMPLGAARSAAPLTGEGNRVNEMEALRVAWRPEDRRWRREDVGHHVGESFDLKHFVGFACTSHNDNKDGDEADITPADITEIRFLNSVRSDSGGVTRVEFVVPGDNVSCVYGDLALDQYCSVQFLITTVVRGKGYIWVVPRWYAHTHRDTVQRHHLRGTVLVNADRRWEDEGDAERKPIMSNWFLADNIRHQVLVKHSCKRRGMRGYGGGGGVPRGTCYVCPTVCVEHRRPRSACSSACARAPVIEADWCDMSNQIHEVLDRDAGFVARTELGRPEF